MAELFYPFIKKLLLWATRGAVSTFNIQWLSLTLKLSVNITVLG